jgi:signal transduction histidine kinase
MNEALKILVIDDDGIDRTRIRSALQQSGVELTSWVEVETGTEALAQLERAPFDCVIVDFRLSDGDGFELVQQIRDRAGAAAILVLMGQGDVQQAVELIKAGANDYLSKSRLVPEELARRIALAIENAQLIQALQEREEQLACQNAQLIQQNQALAEQRQKILLQNLQLIEAAKLKSQFLATMSHELRTPMNAVMGFSQLLLRQKTLTPIQTEMVERILDNSRNLLALINDVLDLSKIESGRLDLKPGRLNVERLLRTTIEELRSIATHKQLSLAVETQLANPWIVNDSTRLRQIVSNLLSNALKFTDVGCVTVRVWEVSPDRIAIAVQDTGIGIAGENLEHIFEEFRQIDQTISRRHPGTGLGLAITKWLVELMQGSIGVESELGVGSTFTVELPRQIQNNGSP